VGALLLVILVSAAALLLRDRLLEYERYGYLGIFITTLVGSATVVLPVPALAIVYVAGSIWNPLLVGLVAGLGDAMGESTGYLAGYAGQGLLENAPLYRRFEKWMLRNGFLTVFFLSVIPNPFFDLAGVAAGASQFPAKWFFLAAWMGKTIKDTAIALAGFYSVPVFTNSILPGLTTLLQ
jgi:membrane protein DedA with SNARE-associated domain